MRGKKPARKQAMFIAQSGLKHEEWLVQKNTEEYMQVLHRKTGEVKRLYKDGVHSEK